MHAISIFVHKLGKKNIMVFCTLDICLHRGFGKIPKVCYPWRPFFLVVKKPV